MMLVVCGYNFSYSFIPFFFLTFQVFLSWSIIILLQTSLFSINFCFKLYQLSLCFHGLKKYMLVDINPMFSANGFKTHNLLLTKPSRRGTLARDWLLCINVSFSKTIVEQPDWLIAKVVAFYIYIFIQKRRYLKQTIRTGTCFISVLFIILHSNVTLMLLPTLSYV